MAGRQPSHCLGRLGEIQILLVCELVCGILHAPIYVFLTRSGMAPSQLALGKEKESHPAIHVNPKDDVGIHSTTVGRACVCRFSYKPRVPGPGGWGVAREDGMGWVKGVLGRASCLRRPWPFRSGLRRVSPEGRDGGIATHDGRFRVHRSRGWWQELGSS